MFCATFYSYKGGVGRTLALANVACVLARQGKRVLVVDFDLEAPGLVAMPCFSEAAGKPGIVDLIEAYVASGTAPDIRSFTHSCEIVRHFHDTDGWGASESFTIDVTPAGLDGEVGYAERLNQIDWKQLYADKSGFLLMEDVRAQWRESGYDYVLIDSRTGLTDVGGICTRQLPDAVVAVFFPNEQNLAGLRQIVPTIRTAGARPDPIRLLFVASRVPRLDDEHGHLQHWLERFRDELGYGDDDVEVVQHYDSMMLLNQALFVLDRPGSSLAREYEGVARMIARANDEDADGALVFLNSLMRGRLLERTLERAGPLARLNSRLDRIRTTQSDDFAVQFALARAHYKIRDLIKAEEACDRAIAAQGSTRTTRRVRNDALAAVYRLRLRVLSELGRSGEALDDARWILQHPDSGRSSIVDAALALASAAPGELQDPMSLPAMVGAEPTDLLQIGEQLAALEGMQTAAAALVEAATRKLSEQGSDPLPPTDAQLVLIAGGHFETALAIGDTYTDKQDIHVAFNTAMASWACHGEPDQERWQKVAALFEEEPRLPDPNFHQCLAMTYAVLRDLPAMESAAEDARRFVRMRPTRPFSCWTYSVVSPQIFESHVNALVAFGRGKGPPPRFLSGAEASYPDVPAGTGM